MIVANVTRRDLTYMYIQIYKYQCGYNIIIACFDNILPIQNLGIFILSFAIKSKHVRATVLANFIKV